MNAPRIFGIRRRREARERILQRIGELEVELRDHVRPTLDQLERRPTLPVDEVLDLRSAVSRKVQRAIETHVHPYGGAGEAVKPSKVAKVGQ